MRRLLTAILLLTACTGPEVTERPRSAAAPLVGYALTLDRLGLRSTLSVEVRIQAAVGESSLPTPLELELPHIWAGYNDHGDSIVGLTASDASGAALTVTRRPGAATVQHGGEAVVDLRYSVEPPTRELSRRTRFHAIGAPDFFFAFGRNLFVWPTHIDTRDEVAAALLTALPPESRWLSTLAGVATQLTGQSFESLADGAFVAGRPRVLRQRSAGHEYLLVVDPSLGFVEDTIMPQVQRMVLRANTGLGRLPESHTVGIVLARADDPWVTTGTGRSGGFVLEMGASVQPASIQVAHLVAHEHLHRYIGNLVGFSAEDELATLWFKEGLVDYLAARLVVASGVFGREGFYDPLSDAVTGYLRNARVGDTLAPRPDADFWVDGALRRLPYEQGFLLALWLDVALARSGGSLEQAVADLVSEFGGEAISGSTLRTHFVARLGSPAEQLFDNYASGALAIPVEEWLAAVGLEMARRSRAAPYYGVEVDTASDGTWRVAHVDPEGPAAGLPLRDGDRLRGAPYIPRSGLTQRAVYVVERRGRAVEVAVPPTLGERVVWEVPPSSSFDEVIGL